jgi:Ca-activated chloride channel homolog
METQVDRRLIRAAGKSRRYLMLTLSAPEAQVSEAKPRPAVNVAIVLDRSGSMAGSKIRLAKEAAKKALGLLKRTDRFALVVYDEQVDLLVGSTPVSAESLDLALHRLGEIDARGSTDLCGGWLRGCEQVAEHIAADSVGKCLLLTDGLANVGITGHEELAHHARELRARQVLTSTFGVGRDFDERLLDAMATQGGGNFYYVESAQQIPDFLTSELGETLEVVARDVRVEIAVPGDVEVRSLNSYPTETKEGGLVCQLSNLVSRQEVVLLFELRFPEGKAGQSLATCCTVADREGALTDGPASVSWTYASHAENDAQPRNRAVDRAVAQIFAARAQRGALDANREGRFKDAGRILNRVADRIEKYAGDDAELRRIAAGLREAVGEFEDVMDGARMKGTYFSSSASLKSRDPRGRSSRRA